MEQSRIDRINELAGLAKQRELTDEEKMERETLRREYIDSFKKNLRAHLESIKIVDKP